MTPLMRQYWDIKALHQDKIVLFRMGDFFELFYDDAVTAAPLLGITLTQRNKKSADETPMCGVPHHSIAGHINKLLKLGYKVAICDQVEDPKTAKGIVKRAVTRVLTPGMVYDSDTLEQTQSHYLCSFDEQNLACVDTTTGESFYFENLKEKDLKRILSLLPIAEVVLPTESSLKSYFMGLVSFCDEGSDVVSRLKAYMTSLGGEQSLQVLKPFEKRELQQKLDLSSTVLRHLEVFATYKGEGEGSLFYAINRTQTSAGARLLRQWLSFPLINAGEIKTRQDMVAQWMKDPAKLKNTRAVLAQMGDIERRLGKIAQNQCHARDLQALSQSVKTGLAALANSYTGSGLSQKIETELSSQSDRIDKTFVEEPPLSTKQGHMIRVGVDPALDEMIELSTNTQGLLQKMEAEEKEKTGISSLKIRYNNVFGFYIEVTNTHKDKAPAHYMRKQTLTNAERYTTDELALLEKKVLSAQTRRNELESEIFENCRRDVLNKASMFLQLAQNCSELDIYAALAWLAIERKYVRPEFVANGLSLKASRHPVVEQTVKKTFVPNDIELNSQGCLLLTGPNMAGKSTLMRQVALTSILAQVGSFVPASEAKLPLFDHIFTRIGASDQLSEGLSTFMVEMTETAEMLKESTKRSLVVLDEIGRGTSTFDGMSLAQSILEYILKDLKAMTLFATHYHELTKLDGFAQLKNAHMTVSERNGEIRFLHTLTEGPALKSYGIQVAKLAGLPTKVTERARELLAQKETSLTPQLSLLDFPHEESKGNLKGDLISQEPRVSLAGLDIDVNVLNSIRQEIKSFQISSTTPLEAINKIAQWQETLN